MFSLWQQMCVPAAVDAADDEVLHGGGAAAGRQAEDAMDLEEPSHPGDLHGSGWFRSPQQYGKHALHDYGWLLKMLTENLHKVLSKIAKRDPRLVQKDECSAKTWDIPKNIKLTPWGRPEVTAAPAAPASLRPSMAGPPEQACYGAAAKAGDTAPPGKRARPGAGAGYAVRPAAGVPVVRGGCAQRWGGCCLRWGWSVVVFLPRRSVSSVPGRSATRSSKWHASFPSRMQREESSSAASVPL